jgi:thioredoxin-related protein
MKRILFSCLMLIISHPLIGAEMGDDGLHKAAWMRDTFKDLSEDLEEANAEGKRMAVIIEQRNCMYCKKMHETVFPIQPYFRI